MITSQGYRLFFSICIIHSAPSSKTVTVDYTTVGDTAEAGSDYAAVEITPLAFFSGQTEKNFRPL